MMLIGGGDRRRGQNGTLSEEGVDLVMMEGQLLLYVESAREESDNRYGVRDR